MDTFFEFLRFETCKTVFCHKARCFLKRLWKRFIKFSWTFLFLQQVFFCLFKKLCQVDKDFESAETEKGCEMPVVEIRVICLKPNIHLGIRRDCLGFFNWRVQLSDKMTKQSQIKSSPSVVTIGCTSIFFFFFQLRKN